MEIEVLGIDLAKNVFQLHGIDRRGRAIYKRRVFREQLLAVVGDIPSCTVVVEACTGAFYWARQFEALGHRVTIISPQYVKPFVRRQKNDGNDAEAIVTAARQPHIPHVPKKTIEQQDIQAVHRPPAADGQSPNGGCQSDPRPAPRPWLCLRQVDHPSASGHPSIAVSTWRSLATISSGL
jgi:hypothetical protein